MLSPTILPMGISFGSYDSLRIVCERCASVTCVCGLSRWPSAEADQYLTQVGRTIRDFVDGIAPNDLLYQHISVEDVAKVIEFKGLVIERMRRRDEGKRNKPAGNF